MKFSRANLLEIVMLAERDFSYEDIAARCDCARKSIYNWLSESRARADAGEGAESPYFIIERQDHFHNLLAAARRVDPRKLPPMPLSAEEEFAERARIDDEAEQIIEDAIVERGLVVSAEQLRPDIEELRTLAKAWAARPKTPGRAVIYGRHVPGDPPERITGPRPEPVPLTVRDGERAHPRAHFVNTDLKKPEPPPPWAKPAQRLDVATIGAGNQGTPPEEGRFSVGPTKSYSTAERRAGTVSISENGIKRW